MGALSTEQQEVVEALKEDGDKLASLVNELLELSRIESGRAIYQFEPCSANEIIVTSVRGFIEIAARRGIHLLTELAEELPLVEADFDKISWVVNNLINNALKYTDSGDSVTISTRGYMNAVCVSVKDTGIGILPEYIDHVFDKFFQVKGREIEVRGTGLGLYVSREIVNAHKGEIRVTSKPGEGSTFTFTLPVSKIGVVE
jgi:signal transduction histidine kinase